MMIINFMLNALKSRTLVNEYIYAEYVVCYGRFYFRAKVRKIFDICKFFNNYFRQRVYSSSSSSMESSR